MRARSPSQAQTVLLKPADPFDLIRWLARSQSDPRKAVAELVQNSIDAQARRILIERRRVRRAPALAIRDDGEGVLPGLNREEALRTIATNIGCSRKRNLTPLERQAQVVAGKYGIGLLGFWSVGRRMDIRSRVSGSEVFVLRLREDEERAEIFRDRMAMDSETTFTEVVITEVHDSAARVLSGRRLADYLSAELRGPLLSSGADVGIHDGLARGTAAKRFAVVPRRYTGEPLDLPARVDVPGFSPLLLELYFSRGAERPAVELACSGTLVADDLSSLGALGLGEPPWVGRGLSGLIDFADFQVPPGTRRGVVPDAAAAAFRQALVGLAPQVTAELDRMERERGVASNRQIMSDLRRAFRGLRDRLPQYELPAVDGADSGAAGLSPTSGLLPLGENAAAEPTLLPPDRDGAEDDGGASLPLFPPGPLASAAILPAELTLAPGRERRVRAVARDESGRRLDLGDGMQCQWHAASAMLAIVGQGPRPAVVAAPAARIGTREVLHLTITQDERVAAASATVAIVEEVEPEASARLGIPRPELLDEPGASWRSRFLGQRWQVNAGHEDFAALAGEARARLRYLLTLLAKEIVARTHGGPGAEQALEGLVEILAHAERNLRGS
jgi:hypothetical protein